MIPKLPVRKFLLAFTFWLGVSPLAFAQKASNDWQVWETQIQPVSEKFSSLDKAQLILTVKNIGKDPRPITLPYLEKHEWPQWIQIYKNGKQLPPKVDEDYVYRPGTLQPGEKISLLVPLEKFYEAPLPGSQKGRYELVWGGTTLGLAQEVRAEFTIDPKIKTTPDFFSMDLWKKVLASPSDTKWLSLLRKIPAEYIDATSLIKLAEVTDDLGIKREAVRTIGRLGKNPEAESLLVELLKKQKDKPLVELGVLSLMKLRGESE